MIKWITFTSNFCVFDFFFFFGIIISNTVLWELIGKCKLNYLQRMIAGEWDYEHLDFHRGIYYGTGRKGIYSVELRKGQSKVWCFAKTYDKKLCSVQSLSCRTLCDSLDCSTPGFPVHHHLSELAQSHVHCVKVCNFLKFVHLLTSLGHIDHLLWISY